MPATSDSELERGYLVLSDEIATLLAQKFIARRDAKAIQMANGEYHLHTVDGKRDSARLPWKMGDLRAHLAGEHTYGHYLLSEDNQCKLFAFDIDLEKQGWLPTGADWTDFEPDADLRARWLDRKAGLQRSWMKYQFKRMAHMLAKAVVEELGIPTAVAYSGGKGVHVYGLTGLMPAAEVREAAEIVLDTLGCFKLIKGEHFFKHENEDPEEGFPNLSIEVFPKQKSLEGKAGGLGNLMRLPLGRNKKSKDPTFFIDMRSPLADMVKRDAMEALSIKEPWA